MHSSCWVCDPWLTVALVLVFGGSGCGTSPSTSSWPSPPAVANSQFGHVFLIVEENHSFSEVIGNSTMPYLNSLASSYGLPTQYYADTHPSIGNYFMLTTGQIITNDEQAPIPTVTADNVVRELASAGKTWKSYAENLPWVGYTGPDAYPYVQHHNPFVFLSDVLNGQTSNLVPFSQFASDLTNGQLAHFSYIVPNNLDNAHDGTLAQADSWLKQNIAPRISSSVFQGGGLLIITFDESDLTDVAHGGGHTVALIVSSLAKRAYQSTTLYQHESTLRLILRGLGVGRFPGAAATAPDMAEFF